MRESTGGRLALRRVRRKLVRPVTGRVLDALAGMETTRPARNPEVAGELLSHYQPAYWTVLRDVFRADPVRPDDVFCDFGCGKGRVLYLASWYPFRSIHGVDLDRGMVAAAKRNLTTARGPARLQEIEVVHGDARTVRLPPGLTVAFLFNPFRGEVFRDVVTRLVESARRGPRRLRLLYGMPVEQEWLLGNGFVHVRETTACTEYVWEPGDRR
jgi:SAM-dependent methyltransferase